MDHDPPLSALGTLVAELENADNEHPDIAVTIECGWTLSAFRGGHVIWENVEADDVLPQHMLGVNSDQLLILFRSIATGDLAVVERQPWMNGY